MRPALASNRAMIIGAPSRRASVSELIINSDSSVTVDSSTLKVMTGTAWKLSIKARTIARCPSMSRNRAVAVKK